MIDRYDDRKQYKERKNKNIEEIIKMQRERDSPVEFLKWKIQQEEQEQQQID